MANREELRDLAERMISQGSEMSRLGAQIIRDGGLSLDPSPRERIKRELMDLAFGIEGLRIDRDLKNQETECYWKTDPLPFLVMSDDELYEWSEFGPGAVKMKIESELVRYTKLIEGERN